MGDLRMWGLDALKKAAALVTIFMFFLFYGKIMDWIHATWPW